MTAVEGYVEVDGYRMYYRSFGESKNVLIALHGGPGSNHKYLLPLSSLASEELRVILYDQVGCGKSDHPADLSVYKIETASQELESMRRALQLDTIKILGHSYGGFLALEYALSHPEWVESLVLSSTSASVPSTVRELFRLRTALPVEMRAVMDKCEAAGDLQNPAYLESIDYLYHRHLCILNPWPEEMETLLREWSTDIYREMWGANEFSVTGNLKDWDVSSRLRNLKVPTLITVGAQDELPLPLAQQLRDGISGSKLVVFERSSHMAMLEQPRDYLAAISDFVSRRA